MYYALYTAYGQKWQSGPYENYAAADKFIRQIKKYPEVDSRTIALVSSPDATRENIGAR